ncbi:hypothetical protein LX83_006643 [Goodfellowiella coeruleoviolacea]|uniref:DUF4232 domain-containing protein n=1 Tax=Goodfellowiella coeruleoviolacea TaxID=334858 RepID=A0AAE3GK55_9PSEU|nr:hypothetical protein [Goodfellowiella coeruleoviolacea]
MNAFRKTLTAAALTSAALLAVAGTSAAAATGARSANADVAWCTSADLDINAHDAHSPNQDTKLFWITIAARDGVTCRIGGALSNVRFLSAKGNNLNISVAGGQSDDDVEILLDGGIHEAAVYVGTPVGGPRLAPASMSFTLPGENGPGDTMQIAWPSNVGGYVVMSAIQYPAG